MAKVAIVGASGRVGQYAALTISRIPYVREVQLYGRPGSEAVLDGVARDHDDRHGLPDRPAHPQDQAIEALF